MLIPSKTSLQGVTLGLIGVLLMALPLTVQSGGRLPRAGSPILVLVMPWTDPTADITRYGGRLIGPERAHFGVLAVSDDPGFADHLAGLGYLTLCNQFLARLICGTAL